MTDDTRNEPAKQELRDEIESIKARLEKKVEDARTRVAETAEADKKDLEEAKQKLAAVKDTLGNGWEKVTDGAARALLKLIE